MIEGSAGHDNTPGAAPSQADIRKLLLDEIRAAEEEAGRSEGNVSAERLASIERLKKLIELADDVRSRDTNRAIAVAVIAIGLICSFLALTVPIRTAFVDLDATVSYVAFHPTTPVSLLEPVLPVTRVALKGLDSATITGTANGRDTTLREESLEFAPAVRGNISIASIDATAPAAVRLGADAGEITLSTSAKTGTAKLNLSGAITTNTGRTLALRDGAATLYYNTGGLDIRAWPADTAARTLASNTFVNVLELFQFSRTSVTSSGSPKAVSAIHSGKLTFTSIDTSPIALGPSESLHLEGVDGQLNETRLSSGGLRVSFRGRVTGAWTDNGLETRRLKPVYFDYLRSRHTPVLVWSAIAWALGTLLTVARWWRRPSA
jgi:hypothetical protein